MSPRPPNVLVLLSDEQSWNTLGAAGNPAAVTPHLDALSERATSFDGCHTPFPLCCPSRASLWTAQMPRHHHVVGNWRAIAPELRDTSVASAFRDAGYHTIYAGKWHVPGTDPARMGFADTAAIPAVLGGKDRGRYIEPYREHVTGLGYSLVTRSNDLNDDPAEVGYGAGMAYIENLTSRDVRLLRGESPPMCGTAEIPLEHYLETWQTDQFVGALHRRPDDRPFLAVCSYNAPHFPMVVPRPYDTLIDRDRVRLPASFASGVQTRPREVRESAYASRCAHLSEEQWVEMIAHYHGFCALMDSQVGQILEHLGRAGELDNTIVVYTSDHGDMMGAHQLVEKGHLLHYDEATRVPLIVSHPDAGAARTENLVSMTDVAPTIAELAGVDWEHNGDGVSFAGMVGEPGAPATRQHVTAETFLFDMSPDADGEHVIPAEWDPTRDAVNLSVRTPELRYVYRSQDEQELFDHTADPHEQRNVAADPAYAEAVATSRTLLADEVGDVLPQVARMLAAQEI